MIAVPSLGSSYERGTHSGFVRFQLGLDEILGSLGFSVLRGAIRPSIVTVFDRRCRHSQGWGLAVKKSNNLAPIVLGLTTPLGYSPSHEDAAPRVLTGATERKMIRNSKQNWEVGATVKVGFMTLKVRAAVATEVDPIGWTKFRPSLDGEAG
jgi:hypothetical protein